MRGAALHRTSSVRQVTLGSLAVVVIFLPEPFFSVVATTPWEVVLARALGLLGLSLLAALPWANGATLDVQKRLRNWSIPGLAASAVYLISADPIYLILGFCLLTGATLDTWTARAHVASETLRARLRPTDGGRNR